VPDLGGNEFQLKQLELMLKLSVDDFKSHALTLSSPDELSLYIARRLMRQLAPSLLWITLHDIDIAHAGAYSLYIEGIRRTDRLCAEMWKAIQSEPEYAGHTALFILPDFGRDSDDNSGGNGFQHHRTGDALSRTTWMMALGPGIREGVLYDRALQSTDLVPTLGSLLGFSASFAQGKPVDGAFMMPIFPHELKPEHFSRYPPQAKKLVIDYIAVLQRLPLSFLPSVLREAIEYDYKFPLERKNAGKGAGNLNSLSAEEFKEWVQDFAQIRLSVALTRFRLDQFTAQFVEQLFLAPSGPTHQLDAFRTAALAYADRLNAAVPVWKHLSTALVHHRGRPKRRILRWPAVPQTARPWRLL